MKILTLTNLYPPHQIGGYEVRCQQVMEALAARGHEVTVLTSDYQKDGDLPEESPFPVHRQLKIHGFYGRPWLPIFQLYPQEKYNQEQLQYNLTSVNPDLVHVWNMGGISKALLHTLEKTRLPVVYDVSDHWIARSLAGDVWLQWWNTPGTPAKRLLRSFLKISGIARRLVRQVPNDPPRNLQWKRIYFCSEFLKELTRSKGYPVQQGSVIYCGILAGEFSRKAHYQPLQRLLWVGRLAEDKDPLTAVRALACLQNQGEPIPELHLYGRGEEAYVEKLKEVVQAEGLEDRVTFTSTTPEGMRSLYSQYDALLFTSNWGEPFALTPLEAMASGLPVIMCPDGGDAELLRDGENALAFAAGNPESLARAILRFKSLPDEGEALANTAFEEVHARFDMPVIVDQIEAFLTESLPERSKPEST